MNEAEVQKLINSVWDFLSGPVWNFVLKLFKAIFEGLGSVLDMLPPIVTGGIAFFFLIVFVWHKVKG